MTAELPQIDWPPIEQAYLDAVGPIDADIYLAAGDMWPRAAALARTVLHDEAEGQLALLTVCARITAARLEKRIRIKNLSGYVFQSYKYEVLRILQERRLHDEITANKYSLIAEAQSSEDVLKKILIEELIARMDEPNRRIFEMRILGHTFEEIAKTVGEESNVLRNKFSRQIRKIKEQLNDL